MKNKSVSTLRCTQLAAALLAATLLAPQAFAQFIQTGAGPFDYNLTTNWNSNTITNVFSQTPTVAQNVGFGVNPTLSTGLTFNLGGTSPSLTLLGNGATYTMTLGGDISVSGTSSSITIGGVSPNLLNVDLGGANRTFTVNSGNTLSFLQSIGGSNAVIKAGTGTLTYSGANTYAGGTTVNGGTLSLAANGTLPAAGNIVVNGTAAGTTVFALASSVTQTIGSLTFGGVGESVTATNNVTLNPGSTLTLGGPVTYDGNANPTTVSNINGTGTLDLGANRTFVIGDSTGNNSELNISTPITGAGFSLTKTGPGRLALNATTGTTYSGGTIVNNGELWLNANNTLLSTGAVTINQINGGTKADLIVGDNVTQTIGALTFGGASATSGSNNILELHNASTILTLGGTVTVDATGNPLAAAISGLGTLALGAARTFAIADSSSTTTELNITVVVSGGSLTKTGTGGLRLAGANTYTGGTTVSAGGLVIGNTSGSAVGTGALTVQNTAFLRGSGFIGGATTIQSGGAMGTGGTGGTPGTLTFTNGLTLNDGAIFNFQLGTASDKFVINSSSILTGATTAGTLTINLTAGAGFAPIAYTLFDFTTGGTPSSFDLSDFTLANQISGYTSVLSLTSTALILTATAVPEPSTYAAMLAGVSLLGAGIHRRRQTRARNSVGRI